MVPGLNVPQLDRLAREVAYPRRVGTPGERRAARWVANWFRQSGLRPRRQRFSVGLLGRELGSVLAFAGCLGLLLAGLGLRLVSPWAAAVAWVAGAWLVRSPWRVSGVVSNRVRSRLWTTNVMADWSPDGSAGARRVVFMAHYDTKSQWLPTGLRVVCVVVASAGFGLLAVVGGLLGLVVDSVPHWLVPLLAVPTGLGAVALACNRTGNRSPGVLDNASGLAVMLDLARDWRPPPEADLEVVWVATGAEEVGLDGARAFLAEFEWWWREKPTLLINLDSVGRGDSVRLSGEPSAVRLAERVASDVGIATRRFAVVGAGMDHEPFAARGLESITLLGDVVGASLHMHSRRDDARLLEPAALDRAARLAREMANAWARLPSPACPTHASSIARL